MDKNLENYSQTLDKKETKVLNSNAEKICAKIGTCFRINGQLIVSVSSFKSSGFFIVLLYFIHPEFTAFAASISVLKLPKYCFLPSIHNLAVHSFCNYHYFCKHQYI